MKKVIVSALTVFLLMLVACGSDEGPTDSNGSTVIRVVANTSVAEPTLSSPDETVWSSVGGTTIPLKRSGAVAKQEWRGATVPASVEVKAIVKNGTLYLRMQWVDDSLHLWRDVWTMTDTNNYNFSQMDIFNEDQLYVMFTLPDSDWYDTWNWRSLTTSPAHLAEGYTYAAGTLTRDAGAKMAALNNKNAFDDSRPKWIHKDGASFEAPLLYFSDVVTADLANFGSGWRIGQRVPGWVIDTNIVTLLEANPESRWDIKASFAYDSTNSLMKLVLARQLNSGFQDDLDMSGLDSVQFRVGILDDRDELNQFNSSQQGFSDEYWLILK
jgi:hypothetical protein